MKVRVIAQDSLAYTGRKCPVCGKVCRPGQTVAQDRNTRWVAHRLCVMDLLLRSYVEIPVDGEPIKRRSREEQEAEAVRRADARRQAADDEFYAYRQDLLKRVRDAAART